MGKDSVVVKKKKPGSQIDLTLTEEIREQKRREYESMIMISSSVKQAKKRIGKHAQQPEQLMFSFMPREMTRTSPFFPMSNRDLANRQDETLTFKNRWGTVTIKGERLSVFDETILLALLVLVAKNDSDSFLTTKYQICKLTGVKPATNTYNAIWKTVIRFIHTTIMLETKKSKEGTLRLAGNILTFAGDDSKSGKLKIVFNPYFLQMYGKDFTAIDFDLRSRLRGDITKALYRFLESHKDNDFGYPLFVLCRAINMNMDLSIVKMRSRIRTALRELEAKGFIEKGWTLNKKDYVSGLRSEKPEKSIHV